jgi:hypothetical protein
MPFLEVWALFSNGEPAMVRGDHLPAGYTCPVCPCQVLVVFSSFHRYVVPVILSALIVVVILVSPQYLGAPGFVLVARNVPKFLRTAPLPKAKKIMYAVCPPRLRAGRWQKGGYFLCKNAPNLWV